ncbi:hypothetical protein BDP27DRAFT_1326998 [Rhodocollybia butyracea]|uniref:Cep57 centrosome microtubule-binding domain-containing protein n=1 Tax=Rhodocollybia butyracea TaxID=206335 RepID=A0A9P5PU75_9AGAR|nr:hypothetical protein BDP27DRAFT_1326998 [Rhodocollybia butyracea]
MNMKRHHSRPRSSPKPFEFTHPGIPGDELEQDRIQLEHNLQNTNLSFRLSSQGDESVEYPRHNSGPTQFNNDFGSFIRRDFGDAHGWSYRTGDDDEGVNPYGGETMSTAAHHASALTLTAGLGGRAAHQRNVSFSGAEYDPDRPLENIIGAADSRFSIFDLDPSRSKYSAPGPLVVDSTAELDRILESGHVPVPRPSESTSSASSSDSESRPKISDSLRRVSFSPKRPRNLRPTHAPSPLVREASFDATPKASQPQVRLHPPTPTSSKFAHKARGLAREIETANHDANNADSIYTNAEFSSIVNEFPVPPNPTRGTPAPKRTSQKILNTPRSQNISHSKVQLPDVTGLTNAVESPAKGAFNRHHYPYQGSNEPRDIEVRLLTVMNTIQDKLSHLEDENGISRRRVRELEHELEMCKKDVARERTRVLQKEGELERAVADARRSVRDVNGKGKARARDTSFSMQEADASVRYKEAVEEKKALESLITTLRSHLTRLTSELSTHQQLLIELRSLRESDVSDIRALKVKTAEINHLKEEVERLAGEVEVLRGVVEEGLKERRMAREISQREPHETSQAAAEAESMGVLQEQDESAQVDEGNEPEEDEPEAASDSDEEDELQEQEEEEEPEPFDPISIPGSSRDGFGVEKIVDRTVRTDQATVGSLLTPGVSQRRRGPTHPENRSRIIDGYELERIAKDVEDRRSEISERSGASRSRFDSRVLSPSRSTSPPRAASPALSATSSTRPRQRAANSELEPEPRRPSAPTPGHATIHNNCTLLDQPQAHGIKKSLRHGHVSHLFPDPDNSAIPTVGIDLDAEPETPFPQIRGERLEKLFFGAPEHDAQTCTVCRRRRGARGTGLSGLDVRDECAKEEEQEPEDEGFAEGEGSEEAEDPRERRAREVKRMGKQRERDSRPGPAKDSYAQRKNLPQQTILARVIRELEDDFTHYKSVYIELADQYKDMDPVSDVPRRNLLAQHLREVVDILEQKGDQIASLYDLLTFKNKPIPSVPIPVVSSDLPRTSQAATATLRAAVLKRHPTFA